MVSKTIKVTNEDGLHARAAALFVRVSNQFNSEITLKAHNNSVNGKSIIGVMSLGVFSGEDVEIICYGEDVEDALIALTNLIESNFKELR